MSSAGIDYVEWIKEKEREADEIRGRIRFLQRRVEELEEIVRAGKEFLGITAAPLSRKEDHE